MTSRDASGRIPLALATFFGAGYSPVAPGTAGSLAAIPLVLLIRIASPMWAELAIIAVLFGAGGWSAAAAERLLACEDPGPVVIDEVVGMLVTMVAVPLSWPSLVAGFLAFRVMDIVKPYPARRLERLGGGLGIMADDVAAGVYANVVLQVLVRVRPEWFA
jgi:phosphatidylglycerophosphatase A